jgi:hypothetical protein
MLSVIMPITSILSAIMLSDIMLGYHYDECHYGESIMLCISMLIAFMKMPLC